MKTWPWSNETTRRLVYERDAFRADQFSLKSNFLAHYRHTGPEILRQAGESIHGFCDFAGTGGSFAGVSRALKEQDPSIKCYLVEPRGAAVLAGRAPVNPSHRIQGGGYAMPDLPLLDPGLVDGFIQVSDEDAIKTARRLAREEGIFAGFSSGANVAAALNCWPGRCKAKRWLCC